MKGSSDNNLLSRMLDRGWEFDFFQLTWLLERLTDDREPVGGRGPVSKEAVRFRPHVSMGFPSTDVRRVAEVADPDTGDTKYVVDVTFLGLYGTSTPLPLHYAVDILRSVDKYEPHAASKADDSPRSTDDASTGAAPARDFLDIFHHRLISLFYRSWTKYRYDKAFGLPGRDAITDYLLWLIGCPKSFDDVVGIEPIRLIRYAGILTQHPRSAVTLEGMLDDYWEGLDVEVEQFIGRWVPIAPADLNVVGTVNTSTAIDLTIGEQVYDLAGTFNVAIGPMDWPSYLTFLPDGECFGQTRSLIQLYCADPNSFTIEVKLLAHEVPEMRLTSGDDAGRLGYTSWIRTEDIPETSVVFEGATLPPIIEHEANEVTTGSPS
jgi:type VI secretion system protein ImpH